MQVSYRLGKRPRVHVVEPQLRKNYKGEAVPHLHADSSLCLYYPKYGEWRPSLSVADTIIPWASLWLYYYEVWLAVGEWLGGGISHDGPKLTAA